jgi:hypothetical protein
MTGRLFDAAARGGAVRDAIARAAERTGVSFDYLLAQAQSESGLNPAAKAASSSAAGLYQSWLGVLKQHGTEHGYGWASDRINWSHGKWRIDDPTAARAIFALRKDPDASALMAGEFASDNAAGLTAALGRTPGSADLYFAHFLGLKGASRFLKAPPHRPSRARRRPIAASSSASRARRDRCRRSTR